MNDTLTISQQLDDIYAKLDPLVESSDILALDEILKNLNADTLDVTLALGYLTATLPVKNKLTERRSFKKQVAHRLEADGRDTNRLLRGL